MLVSLACTDGVSAATSQMIQNATGPCAVNLINVSGNVRIENNGCLDERVIKSLIDIINRKDQRYEQKEREVQGLIKRYADLAERMGMPGAFTKLRQEARDQFRANDLAGAAKTKLTIIEQEELMVDQLAADYFDLAELLVLQLKPAESQQYFAKAFRYRPEVPRYAEGYARSLCEANQRAKAIETYEMSVSELRTLTQSSPAKYAPDLTCTLINLTGIHYQGGDFKQANAAAVEAMQVARTIEPQNERAAQEYVANSRVAVGITQAKLGDRQHAKENLLEAEKIFSAIGVTNFNRPLISEALAELANDERNREEEYQARRRTLDLEKELLIHEPYARRSKFVESAYHLLEYYKQVDDMKNAEATYSEVADFVKNTEGIDQTSVTFLTAVTMMLNGDLLLWQGRLDETQTTLEESIKTLTGIESLLRSRESIWLSLAHSKLGWLHIKKRKYEAAVAQFGMAIAADRSSEFPQKRLAERWRRLAQFFLSDFSTAAKDFLAHADSISEADQAVWQFFIRRREDPGARIDLVPNDQLDQSIRLIIAVANGGLPASALNDARKLSDGDPDADNRCKKYFFVAESMLLLGDVVGGLKALELCEKQSTFYSWLMRAEAVKWSAQKRQ
jgi:tetratricopeptide (TPR) repeat protein